MEARELSGLHIGKRISWKRISHNFTANDYNPKTYIYESDEITMITHKKNGNVLVRHGKNNRQPELKPNLPVEVLTDSPTDGTV